MYKQNGNTNKEIEYFLKKAVLELQSTMTEMKNLLEKFKFRFGQAQLKIGKLKYKIMKIIESEKQKRKKMKGNRT